MSEKDDLRRRAEARAAEDPPPEEASGDRPESLRAALHELRVHQIELETQNEELRRSRAEVETSRSRYFDLYDLAPVGYLSLAESGLVAEANLLAARLLGTARSALPGQPMCKFIFGEDEGVYYRHRKLLLETGEPQDFELRMVDAAGGTFWARIEASVSRDEEGGGLVRLALSDVSERKRTEAALQRASLENADLLRELQHRAKNSFNTISALINISAKDCAEGEAMERLMDLDTRVRSVSELYSLLNSSGSMGEVRLDEYCARVAEPILGLSSNLRLVTELEALRAPMKVAASVGLILTELATNAVKYAFPGDRRGEVVLSLSSAASGARLELRDDGVGLPATVEPGARSMMGLNLVRALARQIDGVFRVEGGGGGTRCILEFPL